jgi:hypothetical protein
MAQVHAVVGADRDGCSGHRALRLKHQQTCICRPPFSGVRSFRWRGDRFLLLPRVGALGSSSTITEVMASAPPSTGVGDPAPCFGVRDLGGRALLRLAPGGEIGGRVGVAVNDQVTVLAGKDPSRQGHVLVDPPARRAGLGRGEKARGPSPSGTGLGAIPLFNEDAEDPVPTGVAEMRKLIERSDALLFATPNTTGRFRVCSRTPWTGPLGPSERLFSPTSPLQRSARAPSHRGLRRRFRTCKRCFRPCAQKSSMPVLP